MIAIMSANIFSVVASRAKAERRLERGAHLFHRNDAVRSVYVVIDGCLELTRFHEGGAPLVLQRAGPGTFLAEASVYSDAYHCDAVAVEPSTVRGLARDGFLDLLAETPRAAELWSAHLAREVQAARYRCEILARKTVSERLDGWLAWHGDRLPEKGRWKSVAEQIGVSPEALYRELAKRARP